MAAGSLSANASVMSGFTPLPILTRDGRPRMPCMSGGDKKGVLSSREWAILVLSALYNKLNGTKDFISTIVAARTGSLACRIKVPIKPS